MLVDSHCHLDFPGLSEKLPEVLSAMSAAGVEAALCVGVNLEDFPRVLALAEQHLNLWASVGVHPEYTDVQEPDEARLVSLAAHERVVAIGETGLDYYWQKDKPEWQRQRFRTHIRAARACGKPLIVHMREAAEDTLRILAEEKAEEVGGVMHCFTETPEVAQQALDLGFYLSFSGVLTFKNAEQVRAAAKLAPLDRILVETDAPYLAPMPYRGKQNQPAYVSYVAEALAKVHAVSLEQVAQITTDNFYRLFSAARRVGQ